MFANDTIKPGYSFYVSFANQIAKETIAPTPPPSTDAIGIYWPTMVKKTNEKQERKERKTRNTYTQKP